MLTVPCSFVHAMAGIDTRWLPGKQEDAHEFLLALLSILEVCACHAHMISMSSVEHPRELRFCGRKKSVKYTHK